MRKVLKVVYANVVVYAMVSGALFAAMLQSPDNFAQTMEHVPWPGLMVLPFKPLWNVARNGHVRVGDAAPDFTLETADHKSHFQLASLREQNPAGLVFGD